MEKLIEVRLVGLILDPVSRTPVIILKPNPLFTEEAIDTDPATITCKRRIVSHLVKHVLCYDRQLLSPDS